MSFILRWGPSIEANGAVVHKRWRVTCVCKAECVTRAKREAEAVAQTQLRDVHSVGL